MTNEDALATLLKGGILFCNERNYLNPEFLGGGLAGSTIVLFVNCNDLFYWGCADAEDLPLEEVQSLLNEYLKDKKWGSDKWCCLRRELQPQKHIIDAMKAEGKWDNRLDALPKP